MTPQPRGQHVPVALATQIGRDVGRLVSPWYAVHGRQFYWRSRALDPFHFLILEVLLVRTRAEAVEGVAKDPFAATVEAMRGGADAIVQARLEVRPWAGWADVLLRAEGKSRFGEWLYEPVETKLAKETRGATLVQLSFYAELLAEVQGAPPGELRVVVPESAFEPERYRFDEFRAYFHSARQKFEAELALPLATSVETATPYPEPVPQCDYCNWWSVCTKRRAKDDHISLVAGIAKSQRKELATWGVTTLAGLAVVPVPRPERGRSRSRQGPRPRQNQVDGSRSAGRDRRHLPARADAPGSGHRRDHQPHHRDAGPAAREACEAAVPVTKECAK